jgi:fluoroquinolone transport system permease protein
MLQIIHFKNDIKQIMRDQIMLILLMAPLFLIIVFKFLIIYLIPFIYNQTGLDVSPYSQYILSFVLLTNSGMLGIVTGFMMLDERDGNIVELMSVTPLGKNGYLLNRLSIASVFSLIYSFLAYYILDLAELPFYSVLLLSVLLAIYSSIIGLLLFLGANDKVKGLSYAKALNVFILFAFADLFSLKWFVFISWFFPPYWISLVIKAPNSFFANSIALIVHTAWLFILIYRFRRREV